MATGTEKVVQYLGEAHATELALVRTLQAHVSMTPRGDYRKLVERHLRETRQHADRVAKRLDELGEGRNLARAGTEALQSFVGQVAALGKLPVDLVRGESGEEKLVKNAKDECATEALEIATYDALEALASEVGDDKTAELAARNRADEERTLQELRAMLPALTAAAARAEIVEPSYDASTTGAADAARGAQRDAIAAARVAMERAEKAIDEARGRMSGQAKSRLELAESGLRDARERLDDLLSGARGAARRARSSGPAAGSSQPWSGYDGHSAGEIQKRLSKATPTTARKVLEYERAHKKRKTVISAAQSKRS